MEFNIKKYSPSVPFSTRGSNARVDLTMRGYDELYNECLDDAVIRNYKKYVNEILNYLREKIGRTDIDDTYVYMYHVHRPSNALDDKELYIYRKKLPML